MERSVSSADGVCHATLGTGIDESGNANLITRVEIKEDDNNVSNYTDEEVIDDASEKTRSEVVLVTSTRKIEARRKRLTKRHQMKADRAHRF